MLKRHVEHHSSDPSLSRTPVACASCHKRKLKCDDNVPCRSCTRNSLECSRVGSGGESSLDMRQDTQNGSEDEIDMLNGNGQVLTNDRNARTFLPNEDQISTLQTNSLLPANDRQPTWLHPVQDAAWSLPVASARTDVLSPGAFSDVGLREFVIDPSERGHGQAPYISAAFEDTSLFSPATNEPQVEQFFNPFLHDLYQDGSRAAVSLASQSSPYSRSSQEDQTTALRNGLNKGSPAIHRLIRIYFADVHPYWPILHAPTFDLANVSDVLLGSMIVLASWLESDLDHTKLAPLVLDSVTSNLLVRSCFP